MTSTSTSKAKCMGPRFYDYLNGLREEFGLHAKSTARPPRRFNSYLDGLRCEFEVMTEDIESLRKERDKFQVKVEVQAIEIQNVRNNAVCQKCSKGTAITPQKIAISPLKASQQTLLSSTQRMPVTRKAITPSSTPRTSTPSSSTHVVQSRSLQKPKTPSHVVNPSQQTLRSSTQRMTISRKPQSAIKPTRSPQYVSDTISQPSNAHSQTIDPPSPLPQAPVSIVDTDSGPEERKCSNIFTGVGRELRIEMAHALSHGVPIWCVKFSQDGKYLAAGCTAGNSYVYDVQTGTLIRVLRDLLAENAFIRSVCFSRDGKYLTTGSRNGNIYVWEIKTKHVRNAFNGHTGAVRSLDFSPNGRLLVSASQDNTVQVWNMRGGAAMVLTEADYLLYPQYTSAVFSSDGRHIAASNHDGMVRVWCVRTGQLMRRVKAHMSVVPVFDVRFTPDGKGFVSGGKDMRYWDLSSWNPTFMHAGSQMSDLDRCDSAMEEYPQPELKYSDYNCSAYRLAISPDSRWVTSGSYDATVRVWDVRNTEMQYSVNLNGEVYSVDFSPAGHYLASAEDDGTVRIWKYSYIPSGSRGIQVQEGLSMAFVGEQ